MRVIFIIIILLQVLYLNACGVQAQLSLFDQCVQQAVDHTDAEMEACDPLYKEGENMK